MKLVIDLADDKELRSFVKEQILGQLKNIAREEVRNLIGEEAKRVFENRGQYTVNLIARDCLRQELQRQGFYDKHFFANELREALKETIQLDVLGDSILLRKK